MPRGIAAWLLKLAQSNKKRVTKEDIAQLFNVDKSTITRVMDNNGVTSTVELNENKQAIRVYEIDEIKRAVAKREKEKSR